MPLQVIALCVASSFIFGLSDMRLGIMFQLVRGRQETCILGDSMSLVFLIHIACLPSLQWFLVHAILFSD